jgi:glycosyltransferase involved in cell wall biosynthesis
VKLSVIIPTRNRFNLLDKVLNSIKNQNFDQDDFEVLVIDNGSTDNTKPVIESYNKSIRNLLYFYDDRPGLHIGRHIGLKEAKAEILVYADDDIEAFPTWLEGIWESFQDEQVVLVGGKNFPRWEEDPPYWIYEMWMSTTEYGHELGYLSILDFGDNIMEIDPYYVWGCNFSIRKDILLAAGGFHPDAFPQELIKYRGDGESHISKFIKENRYKAVYNPKASVYHFIAKSRMTHDYFCKRAFNQGISGSFAKIRTEKIKC